MSFNVFLVLLKIVVFYHQYIFLFIFRGHFNLLNTELNPICHLLALLGAHHILHFSRIRVDNNWEGLGRNRSHSSSRYSTCMFGGTAEDHDNCHYVRLGGGILNGGFGMQVGSFGACVKLLREVRISLLQGSATY